MNIFDFFFGKMLHERTPGWITADWPKQPTREEIFKLVLGDPNRKNPQSFNEPFLGYECFWGPGWEKRVKALQKKAPKALQEKWKQQGAQQQWWQQQPQQQQQDWWQQQQQQQPVRRRRPSRPTSRRRRSTQEILDQLKYL
jgi:hypothetical protein